jgi:alcohol dehydrogenase class IV
MCQGDGRRPALGEDATAVSRLIDALRQVNEELEVPTPRSYGIDKQNWDQLLPLMAEQALSSGSPANNPRTPDAKMIEDLYRQARD